MKIGELHQSDNWKNEKHVPVIECPDQVGADEFFDVTVSVGKEIAHPNTTGHHIRWIQVYFKPDDDKFTYEIGRFEFNAHGEAVKGADEGPVHTFHGVTCKMKTTSPGTIVATSLCNIHGLWEGDRKVGMK